MKATAKKIKDNEWIAEVEDWGQDNRTYYGLNKYPIVSTSDKEWLEKNNMDGKEIEGSRQMLCDTYCFALTTPPIHSDPAGEEAPAWEDVSDWMGRPDKTKPPTPQTGRTYTEGEVRSVLSMVVSMKRAAEIVDEYSKQNP